MPPEKSPQDASLPSITPTKGLGVSSWRAYALLFIFSTAQLLDIVNVTMPVIALPHISNDINLRFAERQWAVNAYSLTFGAFLLIGGRFSAVYGPKALFIAGFTAVGIGSIINGFAVNGPMLFVIRALQGIGAAITIPSAITMIVLLFPTRGEQDRALALFAGFGAIGNVGGLVIGGLISETVGWRWAFWIMAMVILPLCAITFILSPSPPRSRSTSDVYKHMDWIGLFLITASSLLFVFAVTEGNVQGWASRQVLPPLIISILLLPLFAYVETVAVEPLIPSWIWTLPTFTPLFFIVMSEYAYMNVTMFQMSNVFQQVWQVSALNAAVRTIPFGLTGLVTTLAMGFITPRVSPRWILTGGQLLVLGGTVLLTFAPTKDKYWPIVFPAFIISPCGIASGFVSANIAMLRTPLFKPGVDINDSTALIGAIFNANLQIGSSIALAIVTAITIRSSPDPSIFAGYRAAWWFIIALAGFEAILAAVSLRGNLVPPERSVDSDEEKAEDKDALTMKYSLEVPS
ncbi:hypothetical protein Hypma_001136 [Hypsizygus marmoreus]|uniref:Major facilitator superfamily (MFS) profile domain-containing protein n=1 Tax=Hypsizygus marmoreus TaxID=39966 RepID=A0A369JAV4_HYPMA|nr:hypothetical protein Hypma_001136 [Hypsizygus marmoreus]